LLVRVDGLCIGQASHAWLSGQLARAWKQPFGRWEEVCLAAEQHDVGMAEWDLAPALDASTGMPVHFTRMQREVHVALWEAAPRKVLAQSAYAALLVSLHGTGLYERFPPGPEHAELVAGYVERQRSFQEQLIEGMDLDVAEVREAQRLIAVWDEMSLGLCLGWEPVPHLEPWPFREERVVLRCEGRRLAGPFADEAAMHAALAAAPPEPVEIPLSRQ
jgi:hypothetical protein